MRSGITTAIEGPVPSLASSLIHLADQVAWQAGCPSTVGTTQPTLQAGCMRTGADAARSRPCCRRFAKTSRPPNGPVAGSPGRVRPPPRRSRKQSSESAILCADHLHLGGVAGESVREGLQRSGHLCELFSSTTEGGLKQSLEGTTAASPDLCAHDARWHQPGCSRRESSRPGRGRPAPRHGRRCARGSRLRGGAARAGCSCRTGCGHAARIECPRPSARSTSCRVRRCACRRTAPISGGRRHPTTAVPDLPRAGCGRSGTAPRDGDGQRGALGGSRRRDPRGAGPDSAYAAEVRALCQRQTGVRVLPRWPTIAWVLPTSRRRRAEHFAQRRRRRRSSKGILVAPSSRPTRRAARADQHNETGLLSPTGDMAKQVLALYRNRSAAGALGVASQDFQRRFAAIAISALFHWRAEPAAAALRR